MKTIRSLGALDRREFLSTAATATAMRELAAAVQGEQASSASLVARTVLRTSDML